VGCVVAAGVFEDRLESVVGAGTPSAASIAAKQAFTECGLFSSAGGAVPRHGLLQ
jgi:hypothetical protein